MDRRHFFRFGVDKAKDTALQAAKVGMQLKFPRKVIRPPGAIAEEQFLMTCTRCGDCATACPVEAVHLVEMVQAGINSKTPFIDPYFKACAFCDGFPCIEVCEPKALVPPVDEKNPKIGMAEVFAEHCLMTQGQRCDYCLKSCPVGVSAISPNEQGVPQIDSDQCVGCGECAYICVSQTGKAIEIAPR